jgi:prepilin peptidase CpaA
MSMMELFLIPMCFYAALNDFLFYKIPNWIVGLIIAVYIVKSLILILMGASFSILIEPSITFVAVLSVGFLLFVFRVFGAGDAKLLAACSLWMSEINSLQFIALVTLAGGILAIMYLAYKNPLAFVRQLMLSKIVDKFEKTSLIIRNETVVPYAVAIFAGVVWVVLNNG